MAKLVTLSDDFSSGTLDTTTKWLFDNNYEGNSFPSGGDYDITSGVFRLKATNTSAYDDDCRLRSKGTWDFTSSEFAAKIGFDSDKANIEGTFMLHADGDESNYIAIALSQGDFYCLRSNSGSVSVIANPTYSATSHAWWRLKHDGTNVLFQTAPDSSGFPGSWTTIGTMLASSVTWSMTTARVNIRRRSFATLTSTSVGVMTVDNINVLAATAVTGTLAATEAATADTFASTGHPQGGAMNAVESGADTIAAPGTVKVTGALAVTEANDTFSSSNNPCALAFSTGADGFWFEPSIASNLLWNGSPLDRASTYNGGSTVYDRNFDTLLDQSSNHRNLTIPDTTNSPGYYLFGGNGQPGMNDYWATFDKAQIAGPGGSTTGFYFCAGLTPDGYQGTDFADSNGGNSGFRIGWNQDDPAIEFSLGNGTTRTTLKSTDTGNGNVQFSNATIPIVVEAFWDGSTMSLTVNGKTYTTAFTGLAAGSSTILGGLETLTGSSVYTRLFGAVMTKNYVPPQTVRDAIRTRMGKLVSLQTGGLGAAETGPDTIASTGTVAITGSLAATEQADTFAAPGQVKVTSTAGLNVTESATPDTFAASASATITGTMAPTEQPDTFAAPGSVAVTGALASTEANDTFASTANLIVTGTLAPTDQPDTIAVSGAVQVNSTSFNAAEPATPDTFASTAKLTVTGTLAVTEPATPDTAAGSGTVQVTGALASTEANDTFASTAKLIVSGPLAASETGADAWTATSGTVAVNTTSFNAPEAGPDTFGPTSGGVAVTGSLAATDQPDTFNPATGSVSVSSAMSAFETSGSDTASGSGTVLVQGSLASTEAADTAQISGKVPVNSTSFNVSEAATPDTFAGTASLFVQGALAPVEPAAPDTFSGTANLIVTGTLAATDQPDTAASTGTVLVQGALAATEPATADTFAGAAQLIVTGALASTEPGPDTLASTAKLIATGALAVTEPAAPDTAAGTGAVAVQGTLASSEANDTLAGTGAVAVTGPLAASETGADAWTATSGTVAVNSKTFNAPEVGPDTFGPASGTVAVTGNLAPTEATDTFNTATGTVKVTGSLAATEAATPDAFASSGAVVVTGALAVSEVRRNSLFPSTPDNTNWTAHTTVGVAGYGIAPDGTQSTYLTQSATPHRYKNAPIIVGQPSTYSYHVKCAATDPLRAYVDGNFGAAAAFASATASFSTPAATPTLQGLATAATCALAPEMGPGWYRVTVTYVPQGGTSANHHIYPASANAEEYWGCQVDVGFPTAKKFIPTTTAAVSEADTDSFVQTTGKVFVTGVLAATEAPDTFAASSNPVALVFSSGAVGSWFKGDPGNFSQAGVPFDRNSTYNYAGATTYDRQADRWHDLSPTAHDMVAPDYANDPIFAMIGADPGAQANETWGTTAYGKVAGVGGASTGFYYAAGVTPDAYEGTIWSDANGNTGFAITWEQDTPAFHFSAGTGSARVEVTSDTLNTQFQNGTTPVVLECWYDGANLNIRVNGDATTSTPVTGVIAGNADVLIGTSDTVTRAFVRTFQQVYTKDYVPSQSVRDGVRVELGKSIGIAGPAAATESAADTIAAPGAVKVTGALAVTEANDTFTGAASIVSTGSLSVAEPATPDTWTPTSGTVLVKGPLAVTETGSDTHAASGTVLVQGALAATEPADTIAAPGKVLVQSTAGLNVSETGADTWTPASGTVAVTGALAATEAADTAASTGTVLVQGSMAPTEQADTTQITGAVAVVGALAVSETGNDTCFGTAGLIAGGTLAATEQPDTLSASGAVAVSGALAATEPNDTMASTGAVIVQGALARAETGNDTAASTGTVLVQGAAASTETGIDTAAATGTVAIVSTAGLNASEFPVADTAAGSGAVKVVGALSVSEPATADTAASTGAVPVRGAAASTETGTDTLAASGIVPVTGSFSVTELNDGFTASADPVALVFASGANGFWLKAKPGNMLQNGVPIDRMSTYNYAGATDYDRQVDTFRDSSPNGRNMVAPDIANGEPIYAMIGADPGAQAGELWGTTAYGKIAGAGGASTAFYFAGGITFDAYDVIAFTDANGNTGFRIEQQQDSAEIVFSAGTGSARVEIRGPSFNPQFQNGTTPVLLECWYESGFLNMRVDGVPSTPVACATVAAGNPDILVGTEDTVTRNFVRTFQAVYAKDYVPSSAVRDGVRLQLAKSIGITGPVATSEAPDTMAAPGTVLVQGSLASTEQGADAFAGAGQAKVSASLAVTESGNDTAASTGAVAVQGSLARAETGNDTAASTGTVAVQGSFAFTEASTPDTFTAAGAVAVSGALAAAEQAGINDTFSATAGVVAGGNVNAVESGSDTAAATGAVAVAGSMGATETNPDSYAATGAVAVQGALAVTEANDTLAATGGVLISGTTNPWTETGTDALAFTGQVKITGTTTGWAEPASQDTWTPTTGTVRFTGTMATTEPGPDTFSPTTGTVEVHGDMMATEPNDTFIASADPMASCFATGANGYWLKAVPANLLLSGTPLDRMSTFQGSYPPGTDPTNYDRTADTWKDSSPNQRNMVMPDYANDPLFGLVGDTGNFMQGLMWATTGYGRVATVGGSTSAFYYAGGVTPDAYDGVLWSDANGNTGFKLQNDQDTNTVIFSAGTGTQRISVAAPNFQAPAPANGYRPILLEAWYDGVNLNIRVNGGAVVSAACPVVAAGNANALIGKGVATDTGKYVRTFQQVMTKNYLPPLSVREGVRQELAKSMSVHIGPMAPTEGGADAIAATGGVMLTATFSALETGSDTAAITGIKERIGTLNVQDAPDTFAATGTTTIQGDAPIAEAFNDVFNSAGQVPRTGTAAATETGSDTIAVQGYPHPTGALVVSEVGSDSFTPASGTVLVQGAASATEGSDSFGPTTGAVLVQGSAPLAETGADTAAIIAQTNVRGPLAAAEAGSDTATSTGGVLVQGALAATEPADTTSMPGSVRVIGTLAVTEPGNDTMLLTGGTVLVQGALAATEPADTLASTGSATVRGALAVAEVGDDSFTPTAGTVAVKGALATAEAGQDAFASAGVRELRGTLAVSEAGADGLAASGTVAVQGTMAASEVGTDTATGTGQVPRAGALLASEAGGDSCSVLGGVQVQGTFSASEDNDTLSSTGAVVHIGTMAATEEVADGCAIVGTVKVQGGLTAIEASDTLSGTGSVRIVGTVQLGETVDIALIAGEVLVAGAFVAVETAGDTAAATGTAPRIGQLLAVEVGSDGISMTARLLVRGSLAVTDPGPFDGFAAGGIVRDATEGTMDAIEDPDGFAADGVVFWFIPIERTYVVSADGQTLYVPTASSTLFINPQSDTLVVPVTD